jgi:CubicO group peptidase (beta-lactamase class C family)
MPGSKGNDFGRPESRKERVSQGRPSMLAGFRGAILFSIVALGATASAQLAASVETKKRVDAIFADFEQRPSPGCALAVVKGGEIAYQHGYGMANLEHNIPITPDSVFYIASDSKQFTAFSIALLVEEGKLSLDARISKYFPELPESVYGQITVDQLIHHTSGIREYGTLWNLRGEREEGPLLQSAFLDMMARQKALNFKPGDEFMYSNSGYVLLGMLVSRVSGKPLAEFTAERIFRPLHMDHTAFRPDHTVIVKDRATGYGYRDGQNKIDFTSIEPTGDGGLMTTVGDLYQWDQNFYHNRLGKGSQELIKLVETPGVTNGGKKLIYAFGLGLIEYKGLTAVTHSGLFAGYKSYMIRFPQQKFSVICLCNSDGPNIAPWDLGKKVVDIYLADQLKAEPAKAEPSGANSNAPGNDKAISLSEQELAGHKGTFREEDGTIWKLSVHDGKLVAAVQGITFPLVPLSPSHFKAVGAPQSVDLYFPADQSSKNGTVELQVGQQPRSTLSPVATAEVTDFSGYTGEYYSNELDVRYKIYVADGKAYVKDGANSPEMLEPLSPDDFKMGNNSIRFDRDPSGKTVGFRVDAEGAKNLEFTKVPDLSHP